MARRDPRCTGVTHFLLVFLVLCAACGEGPAEPSPALNVVVLVPDTVRADHVSKNGYSRPTTPHLDQLATDGASFAQAVTVAPRTWQSFTSILTGLYPPHHGVRHIFDEPLEREIPTLASWLGDRGYRTAAFDTMAFIEQMTGGAQFQEHYLPDLTLARAARRIGADASDAALAEQVVSWMSRGQGRPSFAFVRMSGAHWPYVADLSWLGDEHSCAGRDHSFNQGSYGLAVRGRDIEIRDEQAHRRLIWNADLKPEDREHMIAHYDAALRRSDEEIGNIVDGLDALGRMSDTVLVVTSDHGESFGEHGYLQHGPRIDESVLRVPLVVRLPDGHPAHRRDVVVEQLVRVVDIAPTLLDALGLPVPEGLDGRSLLPLLEGKQMPALWAYSETGRSFMGVDPERHLPGVEGKQRSIRTDRFKLVRTPRPEGPLDRLYDLASDPEEQEDIAALHPDVSTRLAGHLEEVMATERPSGPEASLDEAQREALRALGYLD